MTMFAMFIITNFSQPSTLIIILISMTSSLALKSFIVTKMSMFSYMIMLAILGGLIILFIYMASLAPNEKFMFKLPSNKIIYFMAFSFILMNMTILFFVPTLTTQNFKSDINSILNFPLLMSMISMYLLLSLIAIVKITNFKKGPLRSI